MGYYTYFCGTFNVTPPMTKEHREYINNINKGSEGAHQVQPDSWCGWFVVDKDGFHDLLGEFNPDESVLRTWDGLIKFYDYTEWLEYLIKNLFEPNGYTVNGEVQWDGDERDDTGTITITNNKVEAISTNDLIFSLRAKVAELQRELEMKRGEEVVANDEIATGVDSLSDDDFFEVFKEMARVSVRHLDFAYDEGVDKFCCHLRDVLHEIRAAQIL